MKTNIDIYQVFMSLVIVVSVFLITDIVFHRVERKNGFVTSVNVKSAARFDENQYIILATDENGESVDVQCTADDYFLLKKGDLIRFEYHSGLVTGWHITSILILDGGH